jgi:hypothetical protein
VEYYPCLQASTEDENVEEAGEEVLCVRAFVVSYFFHGSLSLSVFARMLYGSFKVYDDPQTEIGFKWDSYLVW